MSYSASRRLILVAGLGVLLLVATVMYVRRVDTVEVIAVLLFIPVFLAFVFWKLPGGLVGGAGATVAYAALRSPAIEAVGADRLIGVILSRGVGYLAFGALGGWASRQLERSLEKLDVYDQVDDLTGLFNARFFLQDTDLEMSRAARYKTLFSICLVDIPGAPLDALPRRRRAALLADVGSQIKDAVRTVDRPVHGRDQTKHRFAVICPETGPEGARVFVDRLAERLAAFISAKGAPLAMADVGRTVCTFPGDEDVLRALRDDFAAIDRIEHPDHPAETTAGAPA